MMTIMKITKGVETQLLVVTSNYESPSDDHLKLEAIMHENYPQI